MNFLASLFLLATAYVANADETISSKFVRWMERHGKEFGEEEFQTRFQIFAENHGRVERHNAAFNNGETQYAMTIDGPFSHMTDAEFEEQYLMSPQHCSATHKSSGRVPRKLEELPRSVDWRDHGFVTPIKSQGQCGSCWTFSTSGCLEAHHCKKLGKDCSQWTGLAEQQLVDCAQDFNNHGCNGGLPSQAFEYIHYNGGMDTEDSYNYTAKDGKCKFSTKTIGATVQGVFNITANDEDEIVTAVAEVGPVSIAYQVASDFRLYSHGVYDSYNATTKKTVCAKDAAHVNHAVVVVGYGETMEDEPVPFHIIRNSWGNSWGMEGYFWMVRGKNMCGISDCASYPIV